MAYQVVKDRKVWWPVIVRVQQDGGKIAEKRFSAQYTVLTRSQRKSLEEKLKTMTEDEAAEELLKFVHDWKDIIDEDKKELPFSRDEYFNLIEDEAFSTALSFGLYNASLGVPVKNS